jgi:hypothetical protein
MLSWDLKRLLALKVRARVRKALMMGGLEPDQQKVTGVLQSISVTGMGPNSAEIVVSIETQGTQEAYAVYSYPSTEPSVFSSFVSLLTGAYLAKTEIDLYYVPGSGPTPQIIQISCPSSGRLALRV